MTLTLMLFTELQKTSLYIGKNNIFTSAQLEKALNLTWKNKPINDSLHNLLPVLIFLLMQSRFLRICLHL